MDTLKKIVTNGCSGACCEKFNFPFTLEELDQLIEMRVKNETAIIKGYNLTEYPLEELRKIREMLIFIDCSEIDPQTNKPYNQRYTDAGWNKEQITRARLENDHPENRRFIVEDGVIKGLHYTCKHFDNINRVCINYEKRPHLCRSYGEGCRYKGCKYTVNKL